MTHASVALQRVRDVLVTLSRESKLKTPFLVSSDQDLETDAVPIEENSSQPGVDLKSFCKQPSTHVAHTVPTDVQHLEQIFVK